MEIRQQHSGNKNGKTKPQLIIFSTAKHSRFFGFYWVHCDFLDKQHFIIIITARCWPTKVESLQLAI